MGGTVSGGKELEVKKGGTYRFGWGVFLAQIEMEYPQ